MNPLDQINVEDDEYLLISPEGLINLSKIYDPQNPQKHIFWETDYILELPIRMKKQGPGSEPPFTLIEAFQRILKTKAQSEAMRVKRNKQWQTWTFQEFYKESCYFANACIASGMTQMRSVNIIGFNSPEWIIAFYGSIFGKYLPVGIYTTNNPEACQYVSEHSDAEIIIVENQEHLKKYLQIWKNLPLLRYIIVYNDKLPENIPQEYQGKVLLWKNFLEIGKQFKPTTSEDFLETRMKKQKPGNCCTLVYTSGTTGQPKAVMLSHDNYTWTISAVAQQYGLSIEQQNRFISYLPLSHVAAQIVDVIGLVVIGATIWFAEPTALQGTLIETLQEARPTFFLGVPRVWEKIEEKMTMIAQQNNFIKSTIAQWAKNQGREGTFLETHNQPQSLCFNLAKKIVYNQIKYALGLDQAKFLLTGAAPLASSTRDYFLSLNMFIINGYGMSESSGPQTISDPLKYNQFDKNFLKSAGSKILGTDMIIYNPDKDGNGEICYKGRNRFMGYYKNEKDTKDTIDEKGFLHSGDVGKLDQNENLTITGRIKELIITAGGENIAPVLIENELKTTIPFLSQAMIIGEQKKYLTVLLTLKMENDKSGQVSINLSKECIQNLAQLGVSNVQTVQDIKNNKIALNLIEEGIKKANSKAISRAHHIRKWALLDQDFSVDGGELTPTLKLKRKVTIQKHKALIESMYLDPNL